MKTFRIMAAAAILFLFASSAWAATLGYSPSSVSVKAVQGETATAAVTVQLSDTMGSVYNITTVQSGSGTLPAGWILASPYSYTLSGSGSYPATLTISVPESASPGTYSGVFYGGVSSSAPGGLPGGPSMGGPSSSEPVSVGSGLSIEVEVTAKAGCTQAPTVGKLAVASGEIKARKNKSVTIEVVGNIDFPEGCENARTWYTLTDEYGQDSGTGTVSVSEDGGFTLEIPVTAYRKGSDKDGRLYEITVSAENEAGADTSDPVYVTVLHDQGN